MSNPVIRVSVLRCKPEDFARLHVMMVEAEAVLRPGIEAMDGFLAFFAGADETAHAMINTSFWRTLADAQQLDHYEPMLELGRRFTAQGAVFERPIVNYGGLWSFGELA